MVFRRPLHEIALWPAAELELIQAYLEKRPAGEERIERALAQGQALYTNRHLQEGAVPRTPSDFLLYLDPWAEAVKADSTRYSDVDRAMIKALGT